MTREQRTDAIQPLLVEGLSSTQIGRVFGATRNAIIGHVHRHLSGVGLSLRQSRRAIPKAVKPRPRRRAPSKPIATRPSPSPGPTRRPPASAETKPLVSQGPVAFIDRKSGQCVFPMWSNDVSIGLVCGHVAAIGESYCAAHRKICSRARSPYRHRPWRDE